MDETQGSWAGFQGVLEIVVFCYYKTGPNSAYFTYYSSISAFTINIYIVCLDLIYSPQVINLSTSMFSRSQPTTPAFDVPSHRSSFRLPANSNPRFSDFPSGEPFSLSTSDRQRLPKFKTQENSPVHRQQISANHFRFPEVFQRQANTKNSLHRDNLKTMKEVTKASFILDSLIRILKDQPQVQERRSRARTEQRNEFLESGKGRRKRPKIIKNQMTRIFLPAEKQRRSHTNEDHRKIDPGLINAIAQKIGHRPNNNPPLSLAYNQFLPQNKEALDRIRTVRFSKE